MLEDNGVSTTSLSILGMEVLYIEYFHVQLWDELHARSNTVGGSMFHGLYIALSLSDTSRVNEMRV